MSPSFKSLKLFVFLTFCVGGVFSQGLFFSGPIGDRPLRLQNAVSAPEQIRYDSGTASRPMRRKLFNHSQTLRGVKPKVAIVVDDFMYDPARYATIFAVPVSLNMAVIPGFLHSRANALRAHALGHEVLIHMPMEALQHNMQRYPLKIMRGMSADQMMKTLTKAMDDVPFACGLNNHVGSLATSDKNLMALFMGCYAKATEPLSERRYFLDSRTSGGSQAATVAARLFIASYHRDVFLDGQTDTQYIQEKLHELVLIAKRHGSAIGICHVRPETMAVMARELPRLSHEVEFVHVSSLLPDSGARFASR